MKLRVIFKMDIDEQPLRELCHTENAEQTAIVIRSLMMQNMDEALADIGAENVSVMVDVMEGLQ